MERKRSKWCYACACTGRDITYILVAMFFMSYIQFTHLVNAVQFAVLTGIIIACRVWDAINDPMMGTIISNTKSKFGKYRPWILGGAMVNAIILALMFSIRVEVGANIDTLGWWNVAILGTLYLLWGMSFTTNDVSYWSLLPALSEGKKDRDNLTTMVAVFASIGSFIAGALIPVLAPGNAVKAYRYIAISFAIIFVISQTVVFFLVHDNKNDTFTMSQEEIDSQKKEESISLKQMVKILFGNKQLLVMAIVVLLYSLSSVLLTSFGTNFFYFKFGYDGDKIFLFTVIYAIGTLISQGVYPLISSRVKRMTIVNYSTIAVVIGFALFALFALLPIDKGVCFILLGIASFIVFAGQGIFYMAMLVMLTNTIEYDEWSTGKRNEAITFSVRPFMVKLSGALEILTITVTLLACGLYDYTTQIGEIETQIAGGLISQEVAAGQIATILQQASYGQVAGLTLAMTVVPLVLMVICWIILKKKYIISEEMYDKMIKEIKERQEAPVQEGN